MLDKAPADSGSRERALSWLFEEMQLDEVMVFVAKLVTFLVVCGICSVTTVAVVSSLKVRDAELVQYSCMWCVGFIDCQYSAFLYNNNSCQS